MAEFKLVVPDDGSRGCAVLVKSLDGCWVRATDEQRRAAVQALQGTEGEDTLPPITETRHVRTDGGIGGLARRHSIDPRVTGEDGTCPRCAEQKKAAEAPPFGQYTGGVEVGPGLFMGGKPLDPSAPATADAPLYVLPTPQSEEK